MFLFRRQIVYINFKVVPKAIIRTRGAASTFIPRHGDGLSMTMNINDTFVSIQGESSFAGLPCFFIRTAGCNLRCRYCDTKYAQTEGSEMSLVALMDAVSAAKVNLIELTGGEPLLQARASPLIAMLLQQDYRVLVETNGSLDISSIPEGAVTIMDIKCPSSGESGSILWENIWKLRPEDEVKFVISNRHDYEWARGIIQERLIHKEVKILLSTVFGELPPGRLVSWMLEDRISARFQLQIHKYIWPHEAVGV